ncbi:MAG: SAM-dependent methyltransferase [Clostridia bacterium]|nr:SAM-dependent methyltransferase [Clostridia bacterium]
MKYKLDSRLLAVADCVPDGAYLADVGTDHAYLPIELALQGKLRGAVASDIHKGPIESARKNIDEAGLSHLIRTELTDGLAGLEHYPLTDVAIAGMGGMMIAGILERAPFIRERRIRLILQPMQHVPELRRTLALAGFRIEKETQTVADGKFYQILCAVYDGEIRELTDLEATVGAYNLAHKDENKDNFTLLCRRQLDILSERVRGLTRGGHDASVPQRLIEEIEAALSTL